MKDGVDVVLEGAVSGDRLTRLIEFRAALLHGGAPEIYYSSKYTKYYRKYKADPLSDMQLLASEYLRRAVFDGLLLEKEDPQKEFLERMAAEGRYSPSKDNSILAGTHS